MGSNSQRVNEIKEAKLFEYNQREAKAKQAQVERAQRKIEIEEERNKTRMKKSHSPLNNKTKDKSRDGHSPMDRSVIAYSFGAPKLKDKSRSKSPMLKAGDQQKQADNHQESAKKGCRSSQIINDGRRMSEIKREEIQEYKVGDI